MLACKQFRSADRSHRLRSRPSRYRNKRRWAAHDVTTKQGAPPHDDVHYTIRAAPRFLIAADPRSQDSQPWREQPPPTHTTKGLQRDPPGRKSRLGNGIRRLMNHHPAPRRFTLDRIAETVHCARIGAQLSHRTHRGANLPAGSRCRRRFGRIGRCACRRLHHP